MKLGLPSGTKVPFSMLSLRRPFDFAQDRL